WPARLHRILPAFLQKPRQLFAENQRRPPIVDALQPIPKPTANRILVDPEQPRDFLHRVVAVGLDEPGIGTAAAHSLLRPLSGQAFRQPPANAHSLVLQPAALVFASTPSATVPVSFPKGL